MSAGKPVLTPPAPDPQRKQKHVASTQPKPNPFAPLHDAATHAMYEMQLQQSESLRAQCAALRKQLDEADERAMEQARSAST